MYIPLSFWDILVHSKDTIGKNNGVGITHSRVKRWINNTQFTNLIGKGWIGTSTLIGKDGEVKLTWLKTKPDAK